MPDWLQDSLHDTTQIPLGLMAVRLLLALVAGFLVAGIFRFTRTAQSRTIGMLATLVLLTVLIAMVTQVIGNSVARAFGLVGALSIVRFRTVVEDTRDTAFVIFAVTVGMAIGAGLFTVVLIGMPIVGLAAFTLSGDGGRSLTETGDKLEIRIGIGQDPGALLKETFAKYVRAWRLQDMVTARQGAALDLTYRIQLHQDDAAMNLVNDLNRLEGMQSVALHRQGEP